jgi:hypothetical protein
VSPSASSKSREAAGGAAPQLYALPAYADKAGKVAIEMKALRLRMDRARVRALAMQKKAHDGEQ